VRIGDYYIESNYSNPYFIVLFCVERGNNLPRPQKNSNFFKQIFAVPKALICNACHATRLHSK